MSIGTYMLVVLVPSMIGTAVALYLGLPSRRLADLELKDRSEIRILETKRSVGSRVGGQAGHGVGVENGWSLPGRSSLGLIGSRTVCGVWPIRTDLATGDDRFGVGEFGWLGSPISHDLSSCVMATRHTSRDVSFGEELNSDYDFRREWLRLAPARQFAVMLIGYRSDHELSQRALAEKLGVSQPRVAKMESGEQNPDFDTIVGTVERLGTEFVLDVGPAQHEAKLVTKSAKTSGAVAHYGNVSVVTASASRRKR